MRYTRYFGRLASVAGFIFCTVKFTFAARKTGALIVKYFLYLLEKEKDKWIIQRRYIFLKRHP